MIKKKNQSILLRVLLMVAILVPGLIIGYCAAGIICQNSYNQQVDDYFAVAYNATYYPNASEQISSILAITNNISDPHKKLQAIATWEIPGYFNIWEATHNKNLNYTTKAIGQYTYDDAGRVRAIFGAKFINDPYWITYHRYGACGELAYLFAYVANESGFETEVVSANYVGFGNHAWVEVNMSSGPMYYDPTWYYDCRSCEDKDSIMWFGPLENQSVWDRQLINILDENKNNVIGRYPSVNNTSLGISKPQNMTKNLLNKFPFFEGENAYVLFFTEHVKNDSINWIK
ncbi:MAG TPA: transglutaminase domain-containing protein [Methanocorpusculum sp.]|nr:transglutaminase domain-containing protein [Methanocorpusculum sp.]